MFTPLTSVSVLHHQASGLDQAKERAIEERVTDRDEDRDREPDCSRHSRLIDRSTCNRTDIGL
jgi:hypothetical protein